MMKELVPFNGAKRINAILNSDLKGHELLRALYGETYVIKIEHRLFSDFGIYEENSLTPVDVCLYKSLFPIERLFANFIPFDAYEKLAEQAFVIIKDVAENARTDISSVQGYAEYEAEAASLMREVRENPKYSKYFGTSFPSGD